MDELQLEELQRTTQQTQDRSPYDPSAAARFLEGYTPTGYGVDHTPVEQVDPVRVPEVQVSTPQLDDIIPQDLYGSSGDNFVFGNREIFSPENVPSIDQTVLLRNANYVSNDLPGINILPDNSSSDPGLPDNQGQEVNPPVPPVEPPHPPEPPLPPVEPPVEPPLPPIDPPHPPEPPTPPQPPVDPPVEPPHPPEPPNPPEPPTPPENHNDHPNNGFGNGDQDPPGNSGPHNNAENDQTPGDQGNSHQNDHLNPPGDHGNDNPGPQDPPVDNTEHQNNGFGNGDQDPPGNSGSHNNAENDTTPGEQGNSHQNDYGNGGSGGSPDDHQDNGWGNGDDSAPGNSLNHNNAENDQTPSGHFTDLVDKFIAENPVDHGNIPTHDIPNDHLDSLSDTHIPDILYDVPVEVHDGYHDSYDHHDSSYHDASYHSI